jgi:acetyltransferase-like isoleucine patch superfamily enzyme
LNNNNIISKKARIGKNVIISNFCIIHDNVIIEDNVEIGICSEIGSSYNSKTTIIGSGTKIASHAIIYPNVKIGFNSILGHRVLIRENSIIGNNTQIGSYSDLEGDLIIDNFVKIHSNVHIGKGSYIKSYSWLFPYVILTNDPIPPSNIISGPTIYPFAVIATRSTILSGVKVGFGSFVGANSLVNRNVKIEEIVSGYPIKSRGSIKRIKKPKTREAAYPWAYNFKSSFYKENLEKIYETLKLEYI